MIRCDLRAALADSRPFDELMELVARESLFSASAIAFDGFDLLLESGRDERLLQQLIAALERYPAVSFLIGEGEWVPRSHLVEAAFLPLFLPDLDAANSDLLWQRELESRGISFDAAEVQVLSNRYRLTPAQIRDAVRAAEDGMRLDANAIDSAALHTAARLQATPDLAKHATCVVPRATARDLVLPPASLWQLEERVAQADHERRVFEDWNFASKVSHGRALTALFTGPSGTGKTMAAEIIAGQLHMELWKLNLAKVLSRYIGVLEENLEKVFCQAESAPVCLMLDEADSLMSKRSEVRDARDRYANVEVAYLLQRIDEFRGRGVVIFATNLMKNLDEALVRRMRFIVPFPMPGAAERGELWRRSFPEDTPLSPQLDLDEFAAKLQLSGGSIKNICLRAAFSAAAADEPLVTRRHVQEATERELEKMGRPLPATAGPSRRERAKALYGGGAT